VIIVASVSCIYGLGSPEQYEGQLLRLVQGVEYPMGDAIRRLVDIQYERNEVNLIRGKFRVKGDTLEVFPSYEETITGSSSSATRSSGSCGWTRSPAR
jgi:excinuclease ABC subunit B